jgi:hypothetical protein
MKVLIMENQLVPTFQKMIDDTIEEFRVGCETLYPDTWPPYLSFDDCECLDILENIKITDIKKSEYDKSKYVVFKANVNIQYSTVFEYRDYTELLFSLRQRMEQKYKITIMFTIEQSTNIKDRQW